MKQYNDFSGLEKLVLWQLFLNGRPTNNILQFTDETAQDQVNALEQALGKKKITKFVNESSYYTDKSTSFRGY